MACRSTNISIEDLIDETAVICEQCGSVFKPVPTVFDPITLDNSPTYEERKFNYGQIGRRFKKEWPELIETIGELEAKIKSGEVPECCAGYWALFGCHRPYCRNNPEMMKVLR